MALPMDPECDPCPRIDAFVARSRGALFVREADNLLLIRPDKTLGINPSGAAILKALHARGAGPARGVLEALAPRLGAPVEVLVRDAAQLVDTVQSIMREDFTPGPMLKMSTFDPDMVRYPTLSEIALTYGCQNRCTFCYASSPHRGDRAREMTTEQVKQVMRVILEQGHVPSLSFTGGEATLRPDLAELVRHGQRLGLRVNLITNGIRAAEPGFAAALVDAGLASAQVSLESASAEIHDSIVGRAGAFQRTVAGIRAFQRLGIHVHTNTTLCAENIDTASELLHFLVRELGQKTCSMNMVIRTGEALGRPGMELTYTEVAGRLPELLEVARAEGIRLVWYSPIPYCIFNPVLHDLGAKSCACVHGILSVNPEGELLPCSSFDTGLGSLLKEGALARIWRGKAARYWREARYLPPVCATCDDRDVCGGGCPLYWDVAGSFDELPRQPGGDPARARRTWERRRRAGGSFGVGAP